MPVIVPLIPFLRRRRRRVTTPTPPVALTLVSAAFDDGPNVTLVFDRAVDISGFNGPAIVVDDGAVTGVMYEGGVNASSQGPETVLVPLFAVGDPTGPGVRLTASGASGIVAVDDGGTWAGVTNLELPFP